MGFFWNSARNPSLRFIDSEKDFDSLYVECSSQKWHPGQTNSNYQSDMSGLHPATIFFIIGEFLDAALSERHGGVHGVSWSSFLKYLNDTDTCWLSHRAIDPHKIAVDLEKGRRLSV